VWENIQPRGIAQAPDIALERDRRKTPGALHMRAYTVFQGECEMITKEEAKRVATYLCLNSCPENDSWIGWVTRAIDACGLLEREPAANLSGVTVEVNGKIKCSLGCWHDIKDIPKETTAKEKLYKYLSEHHAVVIDDDGTAQFEIQHLIHAAIKEAEEHR
jgi:hypothetical protein